ncbi:MAG: DUF3368 domain-containing protein [Thermoguttaceae bacterium]
MSEVVCNTSPLQYLHQLGLLRVLPSLAAELLVPTAVARELAAGRALGVDLPTPEELDWMTIRAPRSAPMIPLVSDLGAGETEVLALALELGGVQVLLDDALARRVAAMVNLPVRGTLGILLDAKQRGLVPAVEPLLDRLKSLGFRLSHETKMSVLNLAGELR